MDKNKLGAIAGITYFKPTVVLLQDTGIGTSEFAARTCYDSFDLSENNSIKDLNNVITMDGFSVQKKNLENVNNIKHSDLLDTLAWTHFHYSILEHANLTYLVKGISRGVLQEHARHRIQAISVRSTRYTMSSVLNAFVASQFVMDQSKIQMFEDNLKKLDLFVVLNDDYINIEIQCIYNKLLFQLNNLGKEVFYDTAIAKSSLPYLIQTDNNKINAYELYDLLQAGKKKRNVGDAFKHIVTDNWKVDMVVTFNLRSLKNYFQLRDSGAAYFQIQWLAKEIKKITPVKYLKLIIKDDKIN